MNRFLDTQKVERGRDISKVARRCERVLFTGFFCFISVALLYGFYYLVFFSSFFCVKKIEMAGPFVNLTEVEVRAACHATTGGNLFRIDVDHIQDELSKLPWVRSVAVRRRLPDTLWVEVEEYQPYALLAADQLYVVDEQGIIFKSLDANDPKDLPVFTGMVGMSKGKLSVFEVSRSTLDRGLELLKQFEVSQMNAANAVSEIHYEPLQGFSVLTRDHPMQVLIGKDDLARKMQKLDQFWQTLPTQERRVRYLALISDDQLVVKFAAL